jgi:hypothetical protein
MNGGIRQFIASSGHVLIASIQNLFSNDSVQNPIQVSRFHLPDIYRPVNTSNNHEVIEWSPFDCVNGEQVSTGEHNALPLFQTDERHRVVTRHRTDALKDSRLSIDNQY